MVLSKQIVKIMNHNQKFHKPTGPAFNTGEKWFASDRMGSAVTIIQVIQIGTDKWDFEVEYQSKSGNVYSKNAWDFQVRYFHSADKDI